ncbi:MAG: hypothetical protein JST41_04330 [Bacteroidetes bacterium]|jgi:hypothetical protein|nr:hypothetical protein [Bacteroidota bacterium]MBX7129545.1 hypothetical protein [Flavobacteriales bacterium]MCC6654691.1 hypothetical protein [Flavobacteriales bacterium]HMU12959.1 hypothetical protein [Flavobacteriales bacterium]HMZ49824.1 hypothetical protein [Flavobacteriales bacterium]
MEHRRQRLATWATYLRRQLYFLLAAVVLIGLSLTIGTLGYMFFANYGAADAFLNASMILSGMGPLGALPGDDAKWFASAYALFSGIALPTIVAVMLAPFVHRILHKLHLDDADRND